MKKEKLLSFDSGINRVKAAIRSHMQDKARVIASDALDEVWVVRVRLITSLLQIDKLKCDTDEEKKRLLEMLAARDLADGLVEDVRVIGMNTIDDTFVVKKQRRVLCGRGRLMPERRAVHGNCRCVRVCRRTTSRK